MIQVRNVPAAVHAKLKARAASHGLSLSDYLKRELAVIAERPSMQEWLNETRNLKPIPRSETSAQVIRRMRDSR